MPRILITGFCALPGPNRSGVQMRHVVRALARQHTVDVLVVRHGEQAYVERQGNARILRVPISEESLRGQVEAFRRALRRQLDGADYDIVHFRDGWTGAPVLEMRERLEYAAVFDSTRAPITEQPMSDLELGAELGRHEEQCLAQSDVVLVPNEAARQYVIASQDRPERVYIVPPGVDVDRFDWDEPPSGRPAVVYAGTIAPGRGVRVLLQAMAYVNRQTEVDLLVAGQIAPGFKASLELGLGERVELLGEVDHDDIPALIARATVCVAPAAAESRSQPMALFPTKLLEYMACKRAVVAPLRGSATNLIAHGTSGLLFNPGDASDLSQKILKLLENSELRNNLAKAGYRLVRGLHTAAATRRGLRKAYQYLVDLAPWGQKISDVIDSTPATTPLVSAEDLSDSLSDNTDEYEPAFSERILSGPGDVTTVDPRVKAPVEDGTWEGASPDLPTQEQMVTQEMVDDWIVGDGHPPARSDWRAGTEADDEGTPLDGTPAPLPDDHIENRFVAGEVDVADPPGDLEGDLDREGSFTAVSVLLGNLNDDTDGAGRDEPG